MINGLGEILFGGVVYRLGWMLVHSLWQGAAVAALFGMLLLALPAERVRARYMAGCCALMLMVVLCGLTFVLVQVPAEPARMSAALPSVTRSSVQSLSEAAERRRAEASVSEPAVLAPPVREVGEAPRVISEPLAVRPLQTAHAQRLEAQVVRFAQPLLPWLTRAWLAGVLLLSLWRLGGYVAMRRLPAVGTRPMEREVLAIVDQFRERLGISRPVCVLRSIIIRTPALIGHFRPVILMPIGAIAHLSTEQLETIIAHELAHVRRYDYLAGLVQSMIEVLLFHHPAVWWISRRIRIEREFCCDDLVLSLGKSRLVYAQALVLLAPPRMTAPSAAAAATGGSLAARIRRLVGAPAEDRVGRSRSAAGLFLMLLLGLGLLVATSLIYPEPGAGAAEKSTASSVCDAARVVLKEPQAEADTSSADPGAAGRTRSTSSAPRGASPLTVPVLQGDPPCDQFLFIRHNVKNGAAQTDTLILATVMPAGFEFEDIYTRKNLHFAELLDVIDGQVWLSHTAQLISVDMATGRPEVFSRNAYPYAYHDGRLYAPAPNPHRMRVFDLKRRTERVLTELTGEIQDSMAVSPNHEWLACIESAPAIPAAPAASGRWWLRVIDVDTGAMKTPCQPFGYLGPMKGGSWPVAPPIIWVDARKILFVRGEDGVARLTTADVVSGERKDVVVLTGAEGAFAPGVQFLRPVAGGDIWVRVPRKGGPSDYRLDLNAGKLVEGDLLQEFTGHASKKDYAAPLAVAPDGRRVLWRDAPGSGTQIVYRDRATGTERVVYEGWPADALLWVGAAGPDRRPGTDPAESGRSELGERVEQAAAVRAPRAERPDVPSPTTQPMTREAGGADNLGASDTRPGVLWARAARSLAEGGSREEAARLFQIAADAEPSPSLRADAAELAAHLREMAREDDAVTPPADPAGLNEQQRIDDLVFRLRDLAEQAAFVPGRCEVLLFPRMQDSPAVALRALGKAAVPALIRLLEDRRPTRSIEDGFNGHHVLRYADVAMQILEAIAGRRFGQWEGRGAQLMNLHAVRAEQIVNRVRAWWQDNQDKAEAQWLREALQESGIVMLTQIRSAERLIELEGAQSVDFFRERLKAQPDSAHVIRLLWQAGGPAVLDDIRPKLDHPDLYVRVQAYQGLLQAGERQVMQKAISDLNALLEGETLGKLDSLLWFLIRSGDQAGVRAAAEAINHAKPDVAARVAHEFLNALTGQAQPAPALRSAVFREMAKALDREPARAAAAFWIIKAAALPIPTERLLSAPAADVNAAVDRVKTWWKEDGEAFITTLSDATATQPASRWSIQGRIADAENRPMAGVEVIAWCGLGALAVAGRTTSGEDGRYTLPLEPSTWSVSTIGKWQFALVSARGDGLRGQHGSEHGRLFMAKAPLEGDYVGLPAERMILPGRPYPLDFIMVPEEAAEKSGRPWGQPQDGVQVRLHPIRTTWRSDEAVAFQAEARNKGRFDLHLPEAGNFCQVEVDGRWYEYDIGRSIRRHGREEPDGGVGDVYIGASPKALPFAPGEFYENLAIELSRDEWQQVKPEELEESAYRLTAGSGRIINLWPVESPPRMDLPVGKHTIRVAYVAGPANVYTRDALSRPGVRAISNAVEIEIVTADDPIATTRPASGPAAPAASEPAD
ncbi:MAG: hypothetical protein AMXMBFR13_01830 [Phycisphaerae bacterium]